MTPLTHSELACFQACETKWLYRYPMQLSPLEEHDGGRVLGTAYHAGVEAIEKGQPPVASTREDVFAPSDEELELEATLDWMLQHYQEVTAAERANFVPVLAEHVFTVHVPRVDGTKGPLVITGKIDRLYFDKAHGDLVLVDHKTIDRDFVAQERKAETSSQLTMYLLSLREMLERGELRGWGVYSKRVSELMSVHQLVAARRAVFYVMRRARPRQPKINKDGTVSVAACDTDLATWKAALDAQQKPASDRQLEILTELAQQGDRFFRRIETYRNPWDIDRFARELYVIAAKMRRVERRPEEAVRNTSHCYAYGRRCEFLPLCTARPGLDVPISSLYKRREQRHEELVATDEERDG